MILLERGQVFEIEGKKIFTFGGASSHDVQGGILEKDAEDFEEKKRMAKRKGLSFRINHISWWKEELPSEEEMEEGLRNLLKVDFKVDYVLTHCTTTYLQTRLGKKVGMEYLPDRLTDYLEKLEGKLEYKNWYFGHYHKDEQISEKHTLLYWSILPLGETLPSDFYIPIPGRPRYRWRDRVIFQTMGKKKEGIIEIVDAYGTFGQDEEPSYDIYAEEENMLYKHIIESEVESKVK